MKLGPSARIKKRYLLLNISNKSQVEQALLEYLGILGVAKAAPFFLSAKNGAVILAVHRKELENVRAAFELCAAQIQVIRVSGTLKGLEKK